MKSYDREERKVHIRTVEAYMFTFYEPKQRDINAVDSALDEMLKKIAMQIETEEFAFTGREDAMQAAHEETVGIGFYNVKVTVEDKSYSLTNIFGRWKKFFKIGLRFLQRLGVS